MFRTLLLRSLLGAATLALLSAPVAAADASTSTSTNWSGYVAHGPHFRRVSALWTEPSLSCTPGQQTYSAAWVGLGGYSLTSKALEQVGTEADCSANGEEVSSAWFELVPAPSRPLSMIVNRGDVMAGQVTVVGHEVTLSLTDRTRHTTFTKKLTDTQLDVTSADWIVEAPSECGGNGFQCSPLALANFGSETFAKASAETAGGYSAPISSRRWQTATITLAPDTGARVYAGNQTTSLGESSPSPLLDGGTAFTLTYSPVVATPPAPTATSFSTLSSTMRLEPGAARG